MRNAQRTTAYIAADKRVSGVEQTLPLLLILTLRSEGVTTKVRAR
jgi:hypothetical protein